jgi:hypothetical protein
MAVAPSAIREAIGRQRTVPQSVAALLRALASQIYTAVNSGDWSALEALADDIAANGATWVGSVTQNTTAAEQVDAMAIDHTLIPQGMADVFASPAARTVAPDAPPAPTAPHYGRPAADDSKPKDAKDGETKPAPKT